MARGNTSTRADAMYARYSSEAKRDSTSIAVQIEACEKSAGTLLRRYIDEARTGRTMGGRGQLLRLLDDARDGQIGRLFVYKLDRLGRVAETHVLVEDLESFDVQVISVTEGTNALAREVQLVVAADFSRVLGERTRSGMVQRHRQHQWTGGEPPYGYRVVQDAAHRKRAAVEEIEARTVKFIFDTYLGESVGLGELARRLRERCVPKRRDGSWGQTNVRNILTNRMLIGKVRFLRRSFRLVKSTGKQIAEFNAEPT